LEEKETQEEYLNTMLDLFAHEGYKKMVEDARKKVEELKDILTNPAITEAEYRLIQGRVFGLKDFLNLQPFLEAVAAQAKEESLSE
jgi:hypothetical protein